MSWDGRILSFGGADLRAEVRALIAQQIVAWPMLREAVSGLAQVQLKPMRVKGTELNVQFNPMRVVSTTARVDAASIQQRPCFLCPANLPPEEKGIAFGRDFVVLCNPFPVLPDHLVISSREHIPQLMADSFRDYLAVTEALREEWFTVYNGPRCGASAPDHLHFQACAASAIPLFREIEGWESFQFPVTSFQREVEVFVPAEYRVNLLAFRSSDREALVKSFEVALKSLAELTGAGDEPLINLAATCGENGWTVVIFPRGKHRPDCFFAEGEAKLTVSPAAIDLSGVFVTPHREHFERITADDVERICEEVQLDHRLFTLWVDAIRRSLWSAPA